MLHTMVYLRYEAREDGRMGRTVKIAISLPESAFEGAEQARKTTGETRSEFYRRAVQSLLRQEHRQAAVQRYMQAYREQPETPDEVDAAQQAAAAIFALDPWE